MIAASRWIGGLALALATALHLTGLMRLDLQNDTLIAGGQAGGTQASLGDGFADLVEGTLTAIETTDISEPVAVEDTTADRIEPVDAPPAPPPTPTERADLRDSGDPLRPTDQVQSETTLNVAKPAEPLPTSVTAPDAMPLPVPDIAQTAMTPDATLLTPEIEAASQPERLSALSPVTPTPLADVSPTETVAQPDILKAQEPAQLDLTQSLRPKVRSRAFEERNAPVDPPTAPVRTARAEPSPQAPASRGNQAQTNARAGQVDGSATAPSAQRATGNQQSARAGNAAISNYPGQVVRRIQRQRRPRVNDAGSPAVVVFRVSANGALGALSLAQSSGSPKLDKAAMQMIRSAAPFPPPPPGAETTFRIPIAGG